MTAVSFPQDRTYLSSSNDQIFLVSDVFTGHFFFPSSISIISLYSKHHSCDDDIIYPKF